MSITLKPLRNQVILITGATSGIGLATVHKAVNAGAKVFMVARNEDELQKIQDEMRLNGFNTAFAVADVAEFDQLQSAADHCITTFGRIDTWVNNAGISIYSRLLDTTDEEARKLFDTNFWGVVNGSKVAVPFLKEQGGALINIGSVLSKVALPIQGIYSASKFAVKAFTDALRRELKADKLPISVSLVMPGAIDTPYPEHARSHIGEPVQTPPVYAPELVADAILECAMTPRREMNVGSSAIIFPFVERYFPRLQDLIMSKKYMEEGQSLKQAPNFRENDDAGNLFKAPTREGYIHGHYPGHVMKSSVLRKFSNSKSLLSGTAAVLGGIAMIFFKKKRFI